jgi:predicted mannosyl-3-phosphoglycerate phosphatase (HAD superfamily)
MNTLRDRVIHENDAVMFDIDDTLIYVNGQLNQPIVDLLHYSKSLGYKIVIITARPILKPVINFTIKQLKRHGIPYDTLAFTPAENKGALKRDMEYNFILSVGDMPTDLTDTKYALPV